MAAVAKKDAKGGGGGGGIIGLIVVTIVALLIGAGFGFFIDGKLKSQSAVTAVKDAEPAEEAPPPRTAASSPSARLIEMAPIVANLAQPADTWMRVEASILVEDGLEGADGLAAKLAEDILAYLKTTTLAQFEGPSGFQNLREDVRDRAAIRDPERIKDVIIHGMILE